MTRVIVSLVLSFILTALSGTFLIPFLRKLKFGQSILEIGPSWHKAKQGTPTMGGIMFIIPFVLIWIVTGYSDFSAGDLRALGAVMFTLVVAFVGFADDYIKVVKKRNMGFSAFQKLLLQILASLAYLFFLASKGYISTNVFIPFAGYNLELGWFYYVFALVLMVGIINAVNLTDGLDGLACSISLPVFGVFCVLALKMGDTATGTLAGALAGGCLGFLVHNFYPAKIFMGDTGSLFLGAGAVAMAFSLDIPLAIVIAGLVYIIEALSVVIQVTFFKLTGKRVFKMSPLHHHFEMSGYSEIKIVYIFTIVTVVLSVVTYFVF